jgi:hypothetical protein
MGRDRIRNWPMVRHFFRGVRVPTGNYIGNAVGSSFSYAQDIMDAVERDMDSIEDEPEVQPWEDNTPLSRIQIHIKQEPCPNCEHPLKSLSPEFMRWHDRMHGFIPCFTLTLDECEGCGSIFNRKCPHNEQAVYYGLAVQTLVDTKERTSEYALHAAFKHIADYGTPKSWIRAFDYIIEQDVYDPLSMQLRHIRTCLKQTYAYRLRTSQGIITFNILDATVWGTNENDFDFGLWRSMSLEPAIGTIVPDEDPFEAVTEQESFTVSVPEFELGIIDAMSRVVEEGDPPATEEEIAECRQALLYSYAVFRETPLSDDESVNVMTWMQQAYEQQLGRLRARRRNRIQSEGTVTHFHGIPFAELSEEQQRLLMEYIQTGDLRAEITTAMREAFEQNAERQRAREAGATVPPLDTSILHDFGYRQDVAPTAIDGGISVGRLNVVGGRTGVGHSVLQEILQQTANNGNSLRINGRPFNECTPGEQEAFMSVVRHAQLHSNGERCEDCDRINGVDTQQEMS